jgi:N6-adenosine-specific RNA methylase IME4
LTEARFRTIVADPPWPYKTPGQMGVSRPSDIGASSVGRYGGMPIADLCAMQVPAEDDAHLYMWTTNGFVCEAHEIARAWGFRPITMLTWTKVHQDDHGRVSASGMGYYFRGATEHCLFGVRGSLRLKERALPTAYLWPRLPHSVKPDAFYDLVEQASPGPYLELFARRARFGWEYAGNESLSTVEIPGLAA